jgi:hypothetical protein
MRYFPTGRRPVCICLLQVPCLTFIEQVEKRTPPADGHDTSHQWDINAHGTTGQLSVSVEGFSLPSDNRILNATSELSSEFPFNLDMSTGNTLGVGKWDTHCRGKILISLVSGWSPTSTLKGVRASSWTSYIKPFINRPNFDVLINTQVTKVLKTGTLNGKPVFRGVQFTQSASGAQFMAHQLVIMS